jgi:cyclopropane fatty-acyl-phospholipid synthase-like methyltransferase
MVTKDLQQTEEFFVPQHGLTLDVYVEKDIKQGIHHLARYLWAIEVLQGQTGLKVLDLACGAGYGSYMLAQALPGCTIVGGDYDKRALKYAGKHYQADNLQYQQADIVTWKRKDGTLPLGKYDVVISFDTIEHLLFRDIAFISLTENMNDDGMLLLSTPVRTECVFNPGWEHHKLEYSAAHLKNFTRRFFRDVLTPDHPDFPRIEFWQDLNKDKVRYLNRNNPLVCRGPIKFGI